MMTDACKLDNQNDETRIGAFAFTREFSIQWVVNHSLASIDIMLHLNSTSSTSKSGKSWLGLGWSEVGGMVGADLVTVEFDHTIGSVVVCIYTMPTKLSFYYL